MIRPLNLLLLTALGVALIGCLRGDDFTAGVRALEAEQWSDADAALRSAVGAAGAKASPELLFDRALAALHVGSGREAEIAAERATVRGGDRFGELTEFLFGNSSYARCERSEARADLPEAEPFAYDVAILQAEKARIAWQTAAVRRGDWPAARRNVERALLKLEQLRRKKQEKVDEQKKKEKPDPPKNDPPEPEVEEEEVEQPALEPSLQELSPDQVQRLLEKLALKEREKRAMRQAERRERTSAGTRDW